MLHCAIVVVYNTYMVAFAPIHEKENKMRVNIVQRAEQRAEALKKVLVNLTVQNATEYAAVTDKWVWVDDNILAPADLPCTDYYVNTVEDKS